jgi:hypothetical protein
MVDSKEAVALASRKTRRSRSRPRRARAVTTTWRGSWFFGSMGFFFYRKYLPTPPVTVPPAVETVAAACFDVRRSQHRWPQDGSHGGSSRRSTDVCQTPGQRSPKQGPLEIGARVVWQDRGFAVPQHLAEGMARRFLIIEELGEVKSWLRPAEGCKVPRVARGDPASSWPPRKTPTPPGPKRCTRCTDKARHSKRLASSTESPESGYASYSKRPGWRHARARRHPDGTVGRAPRS